MYKEVFSNTLTPNIITRLARGSLGLQAHFEERLEINSFSECDDLGHVHKRYTNKSIFISVPDGLAEDLHKPNTVSLTDY